MHHAWPSQKWVLITDLFFIFYFLRTKYTVLVLFLIIRYISSYRSKCWITNFKENVHSQSVYIWSRTIVHPQTLGFFPSTPASWSPRSDFPRHGWQSPIWVLLQVKLLPKQQPNLDLGRKVGLIHSNFFFAATIYFNFAPKGKCFADITPLYNIIFQLSTFGHSHIHQPYKY